MAFDRAGAQQSPMPQVLELLSSSAYRAAVAALPGYEAGETGRVLGVAEAFAR